MSYITPLVLGKLKLSSNIMYAPLAGCTDFSMRAINSHFSPALQFSEMVKMDALIRNDPNTYRLLDFDHTMHPIGAQLVGSNIDIVPQCGRILEDLGFDSIDLNCGCPVDKVTKKKCGSALLQHPEYIGDIISSLKNSVSIPVTVKIRSGWDSSTINAVDITKIAEKAGASMITIHGRTRAQGYKGFSNWDIIKAAKEAADSIYVIGNGDIFSPELAEEIFTYTKCDGILVSRGMLGKPWICEDIHRHLGKKEPLKRDGAFLKETLLQHVDYIEKYANTKKALTDIRRLSAWYLKHICHMKKMRESMSRLSSIDEFYRLIKDVDFDSLSHIPYQTLERESYT